jgi:ergothioneine biosynthesis protein EgtB
MKAFSLISKFDKIRNKTVELCLPLKIEDYSLQPIADVSPPKWHLGHTSWFFETMILKQKIKNYKEFDKDYPYLFNSYYENLGERILRTNRGNLSRPTVDEVIKYRDHVDKYMHELLNNNPDDEIIFLTELGIQHEQQHQELLITDIKYILGNNPLFPIYKDDVKIKNDMTSEAKMLEIDEGIYNIGYEGNDFFYDNEKGVHKVFLHPFAIMNRLVTNGEYLEFIESGGYQDHDLWLSDGWAWINQNNIAKPEYWHKIAGQWHYYTLAGLRKLDMNVPVSHISYFEAEAFARWKGKRLATEFEWEVACSKFAPDIPENANLQENAIFAPNATDNFQFFGDVWEWTGSSYLPYPFYKKDKGALGEYNAKFMIDQMVLRGGSTATPKSHIRKTYRNFFQTDKRWQFTGIRLAEYLI